MIRINKSRKVLCAFYVAVFGFIFLCNTLTLKLVDDFSYSYSWADGTRVTSILDIFGSMAAHAQTMNGRLVAHGVVQFFLMLPDWIFDIVNTLMFILPIPLIVHIGQEKGERNNLLHIGAFCAMWVYELAFGQVNLWLDGACNYLWNVGLGMLFIIPYVDYYVFDGQTEKFSSLLSAPFLILSFVMGCWGESGSAAFIFMAAALTALGCIWQHKKLRPIHLAGILLAVVGYITIYLAPAQAGKGGSLSLSSLCFGLAYCLWRLSDMWTLVVAFAILLILNWRNGTDKKRIVLALVFFLGAMCANFLLIFAASYPYRVALSATVLLITANVILLNGIFNQGVYRAVAVSMLVLLVLTTPVQMFWGALDIYQTYSSMKANEEYLIQCAEDGVKDVVLPIVNPDTKYSAIWGLQYLSAETANTWPNDAMAKYFGLDSILGKE